MPIDRQRSPLHVLIIDDEKNIRTTLTLCLEGMGCTVRAVSSSEEALAAVGKQPFDIAFLDLRLRDDDGLDLLPLLLQEGPGLSVIIITAYATVDTAVEAMRRGASDYLPKPFSPTQIRHLVGQVAERRATHRRVAELEQRVGREVPETDPSTDSPEMKGVVDTVQRAAASEASVLLRGENGTGKGVLAQALHAASPRADRPFVVVNCPTLSEELLASELFGHVRGAFTGAVRDQAGRVETAQGGTLFLDEIGEVSPTLQAKLLRFLQDRHFERLGEGRTRRADVRVVAATNRDLEADVAAGRFREDLLYRLNVIEVRVPALRERPEDILGLARQFLSFFSQAARRPVPELSAAAEQLLLSYRWPGNVRELRNAMERITILWPAQVVEPAALPERIAQCMPAPALLLAPAAGGPQLGGDFTLEAIERQHILRVIARAPTLEEAARTLGIEASTLWRKRRRYEEGGH